jgi:hypothetical protein
MFRKKFRSNPRDNSQNGFSMSRPHLLAGLLATGLAVPAPFVGQSVPFPTYQVGPQLNGSWVVSDGQVITPAGTQVDLGIRVRAKAIALNPVAITLPPSSPWVQCKPWRCSTPKPALSSRTTLR